MDPSEYQDHIIKQKAMQPAPTPTYGTEREIIENLEKELAAAIAQADAMDEFLGTAARHEKEASAIINSLTADIHITVPLRNYTEMSPKDCYELGMMDGVSALKSQINAAIAASMEECKK